MFLILASVRWSRNEAKLFNFMYQTALNLCQTWCCPKRGVAPRPIILFFLVFFVLILVLFNLNFFHRIFSIDYFLLAETVENTEGHIAFCLLVEQMNTFIQLFTDKRKRKIVLIFFLMKNQLI